MIPLIVRPADEGDESKSLRSRILAGTKQTGLRFGRIRVTRERRDGQDRTDDGRTRAMDERRTRKGTGGGNGSAAAGRKCSSAPILACKKSRRDAVASAWRCGAACVK